MRNVYIVGPSCGGKTSLLHFLKREAGDQFTIPIRLVSRPPRTADDLLENEFLSKEEFLSQRSSEHSEFFLSWHRLMEEGRKEYYAFRSTDVSEEKINIFSANNALLLYPNSHIPVDTLSKYDSYIVACMAPDEVRLGRLKERSPEYSDAEVQVRIYQESIESYLDKVDVVIRTDAGSLEENGKKVLEFLNSISIKELTISRGSCGLRGSQV